MAKEKGVAEVQSVGSNVAYTINGEILTITVDMSKRPRKSKSGDNWLVASSGGNQILKGAEPEMKLGLFVYTPAT